MYGSSPYSRQKFTKAAHEGASFRKPLEGDGILEASKTLRTG